MSLTCIVTGASRGIGLEFVKQLAATQDNIVFACARNLDEAKMLESLSNSHKNVIPIKLDVTNELSIKSAAERIAQETPEGVDVLINNAGIGGKKGLNPFNTPMEDFMRLFETNVVGVAAVTQAMIPILRKRGKDKTKKILNMSAVLGSINNINDGAGLGFGSAYCVSKAALNMLTKMTAKQLAKENFIVYASHPGWVKTDLGGAKAPVTPTDSIKGQLEVLKNLTSQDTGQFIDFNGNRVKW